MSTIIDSRQQTQADIPMYFGLCISILGILGNLLNILVFTTLKSFRETTCAVYLIVTSIYNLGQSLSVFFIILMNSFKLFSLTSTIFCKIRFSGPQYFTLVSQTCMCLAAIDQFLSRTRYRNWSSIRSAYYHIAFSCILWFIHSIVTFIFYDFDGTLCIITNIHFLKYFTYFYLPILLGFLPLIIISVFTLLAIYKHMTNTDRPIDIVRFSRDRQLTAMVFIHDLIMIITLIPFVSSFVYSLANSNAVRNQMMFASFNIIALINFTVRLFSF